MLPWQRKEVYITDSENGFNKIRGILSENNIKYDYKIKCRSQIFRDDAPFIGRYGAKLSNENMYYIYVNKKDYEYAEQILRNAGL